MRSSQTKFTPVATSLRRAFVCLAVLFSALASWPWSTAAEPAVSRLALERLIAAYPDYLERVDNGELVWRDGTRMRIDDGLGDKTHAQRLATADIKDMFNTPYPAGRPSAPPALNHDPGRARYAALFDKMYGDCRAGEVAANLVDVVWLPKKWGKAIKASAINGVAEKLRAVSAALDDLPRRFDVFLFPIGGTFVCRTIAGTNRTSVHGHGIAIDIATGPSHYWQWSGAQAGTLFPYRNAIPYEIVEIFERHGFIWGGKWYHYDTMHFEYRPELLAPSSHR
jgi:hypothetical protein